MSTTPSYPKTRTGFQVGCPKCGATEDGLTVSVADLTMTCGSCSEEVTLDDLRASVAETERLIAWLESASSV